MTQSINADLWESFYKEIDEALICQIFKIKSHMNKKQFEESRVSEEAYISNFVADGLAGRCGNIVAVVEWAYVASRAIQIQADGGGAGDQHKRQQTEPQPAIRLMRWL